MTPHQTVALSVDINNLIFFISLDSLLQEVYYIVNMQKTTYGQNDSDKIQTFKEKLHGENETTDYPARDNVLIEIGKIVVMENEAKDV